MVLYSLVIDLPPFWKCNSKRLSVPLNGSVKQIVKTMFLKDNVFYFLESSVLHNSSFKLNT